MPEGDTLHRVAQQITDQLEALEQEDQVHLLNLAFLVLLVLPRRPYLGVVGPHQN